MSPTSPTDSPNARPDRDGRTPDGSAEHAPVRPAIQQAAEHLAAGRPADAADALAALADGAPAYAAAHVLLAVSLEAAGRPAESLAAWNRAALLVPRSPLIVRERARLMTAAPQINPLPVSDGFEATPPLAVPDPDDVLSASAQPEGETEVSPTEARLDADAATFEPHGETAPLPEPIASPDTEDEDFPELETLPLDDLATSFTAMPDASDDAFDPEGFDFSAFDLGDDDAGWLLGQEPDAPAQPATPAEPLLDTWDDDALPPDWSEMTSDDSVRLMSPELPIEEPTDEEPVAASPLEGEWGEWAVFEDEPETADAPDDASLPFETLSLDPVPAEAPIAEAPSVTDELDSLIASLEDAPRIRPDPTFDGPKADTTAADVDDMASETLARIYAAQHQYVEAAVVYEKLALRDPVRAEAMLEQAAEMRRRTA